MRGIDRNLRDNYGTTALMYTCEFGHKHVVLNHKSQATFSSFFWRESSYYFIVSVRIYQASFKIP